MNRRYEIAYDNDNGIIKFKGDIQVFNLDEGEALLKKVESIIEQKEDAVTLDFLNVSFGNSSFLTSLSKLIYNAEKKNKTVRVCARKSSTWQLRSFTSLSKFAKTLEIDWAD